MRFVYKTVEISPINSNKNDRVGAGMLRRKEGGVGGYALCI